MELHFKYDNGPVDEAIRQLIEISGDISRPAIVREMILASLKAGQEDNGKVDLKLMNASLKEMDLLWEEAKKKHEVRGI